MKRTAWFERTFPLMEDNGALPAIIERLSGTPARLEEMVRRMAPDVLTRRSGDRWTIKEEIGHLGDLEPLWLARVEDLVNGTTELRAADLTNRQTHTANHNATDITDLLQRFRSLRQPFVSRIAGLSDAQLQNTALHPRMKTPMRIIDLAYFVAEHDDHHLAGIRELAGGV
ncbi:DinB family protein [Chitinophaga japonensis]|uniref:DinB family protein n=1 Tax=Chitinophaga japonensis TaxID=104662 RepID=A0A562T0B0_CHIJA|nr:DinB family protein [Chitinophaga japonensis]TWI86793.1 DinB family protein [Chitinophaga japonensis]